MGTITSVVAELREAPGKAENFKWKEFKAYHGGVLVVIARAIFELKYLVSFAIATIAVANHTRNVADEAHCRMQAANIAAAPSLLAVGQLFKVGAEKLYSGEDVGVSSPGSSNITNCLAEKAARLTYGSDLNDLEVDVPFLALIGLVVAIHLVAYLWVLRQAIKEKPMDGTQGDAAFCFALNKGYNSPVARRARKFTVYLTCFGLGLLSVIAFARGTLVQLVQGLFFELYALIHTTQEVFASNEKFADLEWAVLEPRVAGHFEWLDLLKSAPSLLREKFVKYPKEHELGAIEKASDLWQEEHLAAHTSDDSSSDTAKESKALI